MSDLPPPPTDAVLVAEVAAALFEELRAQDTDLTMAAVLGERTIDCEALARAAITSYLGIQRRLVSARLEAMQTHSEEKADDDPAQ